ncbi:ATP-dependent RNA helicase HrpA [Bailinhaonella thermotolerans]|uniref:RNA helicase n=1 Tax=Bailinhaonella thermotolerans TaxID=1070861 RepID=A0A3A4B6Y0_9ACTN|nr:ATP-dependent RNA helicase HrpA [Bailinhaonella thermotolerans]RJL34327.1 ATP-dependent RNA helicase HrpA [Bailinhaonella thermotolerans]
MRSPLSDLQSRLPGLTLRDEHRLRRRVDGVRKVRNPKARDTILGELAAEVEAAEARVEARRASAPSPTYPEELPVSRRKDEILAAIREHQVVIVAGETGSGKTTQLPKICLEAGRGVRGLIGHTQPRRIAARTVADRIAEELRTPLGEKVGYKVRFTDQVSDGTMIKLMTDGILLAEMQTDRQLRQYDTLIIDEAHERSLNIDFILGYVKQLLPRRPDLKIVITSATIDPERFSRHFGDAPIIEVSGRTYPVETRYRPIEEEQEDQIQAISDAVDELCAEGPGDILVFLSGEREIRDTADALAKRKDAEILPLYARLSAGEQHRVFQPHSGRRIVLATNVAETSLTVPGIKYVIDPGTARISRYSHRLKVQRLPIEPISQASANQRKGRCGRTSDGICIRLYSEEDFLGRPEFTDPEILRTNLASVILQMSALKLGDIEKFPFVDPPDRRQVKDGVALLHELNAFDGDNALTPLGRKLAQLPVDPRLARMVIEADKNGAVNEVMVIAAALSIQDPRERPADKQQAADEKHRRFIAPDKPEKSDKSDQEASDFLTYLNLWNYLQERQRALSSSQFRRLCKQEFLNYLRVREWQDVHGQLRQVARTLGVTFNDTPASPYQIHVSLLSGLLSHIGLKDAEKQEYLGARGARFAVFPGSALFKKPPRWVMAAELVETTRLWARIAARVEPDWIEPLAQHLVKRTYSEPHWEKTQGAVMAHERVTLYGVPIVAQRKVNYGRIDPETSRELFIRHALVEGDWQTHHKFFAENRRLLDEVEELEHRARRRDILVDDETLFEFYDERVPADVVSARHFDAWWKRERQENPDLLNFEKAMLMRGEEVSRDDYPDTWRQGGLRLRLTYQFEPGGEADGVTVHIPLPVLNQVSPDGFDWQIPGLREDLATALIRALPKQIRRSYVPAPDFARAALARLTPGEGTLTDGLARELRRMGGPAISEDDWDWEKVPDHLRITFRVIDERKRKIAEGKDLLALKQRLKPKMRETLSGAGEELERRGLKTWDFGTLPERFERKRLKAYPALVDEGDSVAVKLLETEEEQRRATWAGTRRLLLLTIPSPAKFVLGRLSNTAKLALSRGPHRNAAALFDDCVACAVDTLMARYGGPPRDEAGFAALRDKVRADLTDTVIEVVARVERVLAVAHEAEVRLSGLRGPVLERSLADVREQLAGLVYPGFVTATGFDRLPDLLRYLRAIERRLEKLPENPARDRELTEQVAHVREAYQEELDRIRPGRPVPDALREVRWMIEELRVSYFAQTLGTPRPVSDKRIYRVLDDLRG